MEVLLEEGWLKIRFGVTIIFAELSLQGKSADNKAYNFVMTPSSYSLPPILLVAVALSWCPVALLRHEGEL